MIIPYDRRRLRRSLTAAASLMIVALSAALAPAAPAAAAEFPFYQLRNLNPGAQSRCAGVEGGDMRNLSRIILWTCLPNKDQFWRVDTSSARHSIVNLKSSFFCLGVLGGSGAQGAQVVVNQCDSTPNQTWRLWPSSACGGYIVVNEQTGYLLSVEGRSTSNGAPVIMWPHGSTPDQTWCLQNPVVV
ncbi:RICIN domain-containing protein [Actinoplanes sp. NPDC026670]|uniref:RICIN domain-containing protein n=1 Tax=Actinoplanes sp. NPDC026670 TaxID=3154700 RepID=UPI003405E1FA